MPRTRGSQGTVWSSDSGVGDDGVLLSRFARWRGWDEAKDIRHIRNEHANTPWQFSDVISGSVCLNDRNAVF